MLAWERTVSASRLHPSTGITPAVQSIPTPGVGVTSGTGNHLANWSRAVAERAVAERARPLSAPTQAPVPSEPKVQGGRRKLPPPAALGLRVVGSGEVEQAAKTVLATRAEVRLSKDANAAILHTGVGAMLAQLSLEDMVQAVGTAQVLAQLSAKHLCQLRQYEKFMGVTAPGAPLYPITLVAAQAFAIHYVLIKGNMSSSLDTVMSTLRPAAKALDIWALTLQDGGTLSRTIKFLQGVAPAEPESSKCYLLDELRAMVSWLLSPASMATAHRLQALALLSALWAFMARGSEVARSRCKEYVFDPELGTRLLPTMLKTDKEVIRVRARVAPHLPELLRELCPTFHLVAYLEGVLLPHGAASPEAFFFPKLSPLGVPSTTPMTTDDMMDVIKAVSVGAGVPTTGLDAHFGRTTGYNFFRWVLCLTEDTASELGDWSRPNTVVRRHYNQGQDTQLAVFGTRQVRLAWGAQCCGAHAVCPSRHFILGEPGVNAAALEHH
jgi:hypothetical protein